MARPTFFPQTPEGIVAELERRAPEVRVHPGMTEAQIMFDAGRRALALEMRDFRDQLQKARDVHR